MKKNYCFVLITILVSASLFAQNTGIGDPLPSAKLTVSGSETTLNGQSAGIKIRNTASANAWYIRAGASGTATPADGFSIGDNSSYHFNMTSGGSVGLGIIPSGTRLHVNGGIKIEGLNVLEFGAGVAGKEVNAGKIVYNGFGTNRLAIVGAGTTASNRSVQFFAEGGTVFNGPIQTDGIALLDNGAIIGSFGAVNGNLNVDGKITRSQTGTANMVPVCMGYIGQFGGPQSGTGNFSCVHVAGTGLYDITITGETYSNTGYITLITTINEFDTPAIGRASEFDGKLRVRMQNDSGGNTSSAFYFVVYKL